MPQPRCTSANDPRPRRRGIRKPVEEHSHRDEDTARLYLSYAAHRARIIIDKERVVIDLSNLAANTSRFAVTQYINQLAAEYGLKPVRKPTDTNPDKHYFKKVASS